MGKVHKFYSMQHLLTQQLVKLLLLFLVQQKKVRFKKINFSGSLFKGNFYPKYVIASTRWSICKWFGYLLQYIPVRTCIILRYLEGIPETWETDPLFTDFVKLAKLFPGNK